jgi:GAF domain-containing protein
MEPQFSYQNIDKDARYEQFLKDFIPYISDEHEEVSVLANTTAALRQAFGWFWIGFYLVKGEQLVLGPFQGDVACYRIRHGRGVCGTAWAKACTQVVPDVELFPGHIACSGSSRSEIVVPLIADGIVRAVLDIDSDTLATFDETDRHYLEKLCEKICNEVYRD